MFPKGNFWGVCQSVRIIGQTPFLLVLQISHQNNCSIPPYALRWVSIFHDSERKTLLEQLQLRTLSTLWCSFEKHFVRFPETGGRVWCTWSRRTYCASYLWAKRPQETTFFRKLVSVLGRALLQKLKGLFVEEIAFSMKGNDPKLKQRGKECEDQSPRRESERSLGSTKLCGLMSGGGENKSSAQQAAIFTGWGTEKDFVLSCCRITMEERCLIFGNMLLVQGRVSLKWFCLFPNQTTPVWSGMNLQCLSYNQCAWGNRVNFNLHRKSGISAMQINLVLKKRTRADV